MEESIMNYDKSDAGTGTLKPDEVRSNEESRKTGVSRLEEIDQQHEDELRMMDTDQPMTPAQTYLFTPIIAIVFFVAAYFSFGMQKTGESGWAQTLFLVLMGIGFLGYGGFNAYLRKKQADKVEKVKREREERERSHTN